MKIKYEEIHKRIYEFITWKELEDGRKVDLLKLEESHKYIIFMDWDSRLKKRKGRH